MNLFATKKQWLYLEEDNKGKKRLIDVQIQRYNIEGLFIF